MKLKKGSTKQRKKPIHLCSPATQRQILRDLGIRVTVRPHKRVLGVRSTK